MKTALGRSRDEVLRFLLGGLAICVVDFGAYFLALYLVPDMPVAIAKGIAFVLGATTSFLINRTFVFRSTGAAHRQIGGFVMLYVISLGINIAFNALTLRYVDNKPIAWFVATAASTVANFVGMKFVVFRSSPTP